MKKITIAEFSKFIGTKDVNIPLFFVPVFNENGEAWVMEGTEDEFISARDYFTELYRGMP
jgi:hypothetical protein